MLQAPAPAVGSTAAAHAAAAAASLRASASMAGQASEQATILAGDKGPGSASPASSEAVGWSSYAALA